MAGTRVHDQSGRLRHDDHVVVGVTHDDLDGRVAGRRRVGPRLVEQVDDLAGAQAMALGRRLPVDADRARVDQRLHRDAGPAGHQRDRPVEALAVERRRHHDGVDRVLTVTRHAALSGRFACEERADDDHDRANGDARVGDVEHRVPANRDEVDDVPAQEPRCAEDAVAQISERAAEDEREPDQQPTVGRAPRARGR